MVHYIIVYIEWIKVADSNSLEVDQSLNLTCDQKFMSKFATFVHLKNYSNLQFWSFLERKKGGPNTFQNQNLRHRVYFMGNLYARITKRQNSSATRFLTTAENQNGKSCVKISWLPRDFDEFFIFIKELNIFKGILDKLNLKTLINMAQM